MNNIFVTALSVVATLMFASCGNKAATRSQIAGNGPGAPVITPSPDSQNVKPGNLTSAGPTVFAIYMVGSTLENEEGVPVQYGEGQNDLRELVRGWDKLSADEQKNLKVFVAFGGAAKEGWEGMKVADIACIKKDGVDEYFGNETCYSFSDDNMDMSTKDALEKFLGMVKKETDGAGKVVLDLWGHGSGVGGYGFADSAGKNPDAYIKLQEIVSAISNTRIKLDLISFDACLMASLEVPMILKSSASYLVAAEETVAGFGFDYKEIIPYIGKNPNASALDIGKTIADTYITGSSSSYNSNTNVLEDVEHKTQGGKTITVIDLSKVADVASALDKVVPFLKRSDSQEQSNNLISLMSRSMAYGSWTVDLVDFAQMVKKDDSSAKTAVDSLAAAVDKAVAYVKQDGSRPFSHGISITRVISQDQWSNYSGAMGTLVSQTWDGFVKSFINEGISEQPAQNPDGDNSDDWGFEEPVENSNSGVCALFAQLPQPPPGC